MIQKGWSMPIMRSFFYGVKVPVWSWSGSQNICSTSQHVTRTSCFVAAALAFSSFESHKYFIMYKMVVWRCHYNQNFHSICYGESKTCILAQMNLKQLFGHFYHLSPFINSSIQVFQIARYFSGFPISNEGVFLQLAVYFFLRWQHHKALNVMYNQVSGNLRCFNYSLNRVFPPQHPWQKAPWQILMDLISRLVSLVPPPPSPCSALLCARMATCCWRDIPAKSWKCPLQKPASTDMLR